MNIPSMTAAAVLVFASAAQAQDKPALTAEGKALIQQFAGTLKSELSAAMEAGGPVEAIGVCHTRAPEIAASVSAASGGWTVARSSHRLRNRANAPDAYTEAAIDDFLARQENGEAAADLVTAQIMQDEGGSVFRMVKAIPTAALCLSCHGGADVASEVETALERLYPEDKARGFREGEMRGVFTLKKILD